MKGVVYPTDPLPRAGLSTGPDPNKRSSVLSARSPLELRTTKLWYWRMRLRSIWKLGLVNGCASMVFEPIGSRSNRDLLNMWLWSSMYRSVCDLFCMLIWFRFLKSCTLHVCPLCDSVVLLTWTHHRHRDAWKNVGQILDSKANLSSYILEVQQQLGLNYQAPPLPVDMKYSKALVEAAKDHEEDNGLSKKTMSSEDFLSIVNKHNIRLN